MPLDPRIDAVFQQLKAAGAFDGSLLRHLSPAERRAAIEERKAASPSVLTSPVDADLNETVRVLDTVTGPVSVRIYRPSGGGNLPGLLHIHGGGWWLGSALDAAPVARRRAAGAGCVVVSVDYRLAPEHPFPAALDDCYGSLLWMHEHSAELGIDQDRIAVAGESAGANIAAALTLRVRDEGGPKLLAQVLEVPACDLTMSRPSIKEFDGIVLGYDDLKECVAFYAGDESPTHPLISPFYAELHGLPPALVMTAECDPVRDDGEAYAAKLAAAGVPTTFRRWDGMAHGSCETDLLVPEVAAAYSAQVHQFLRAAFAQVQSPEGLSA